MICRRLTSLLAVLLASLAVMAGSRGDDRYLKYIETYAPMAVQEMHRAGIPASITLAQGLLESSAGRSTLAVEGNNHFGIKCADWKGASMKRDDDAPDECFRVYGSVAESYADHSDFLHRRRYQSLFDLDITDYAAWATGLRQCGYATDPNYADRLITIIERYSLYRYDDPDAAPGDATAGFIAGMLASRHHLRRSRGLHYVVAAPGDTYATIAKEFNLKTKDLLEYNDAPRDGEIKAWEEVYLQPKHDEAPKGVKSAVIGDGESIHSIAQRYGMTMASILRLNPSAPDTSGTRLRLR